MHAGIVAWSRSATPDGIAQVVSNCSVDTVVIVGIPERGPVHAPLRQASAQTSICFRPVPDTRGTALEFGRHPAISNRSTTCDQHLVDDLGPRGDRDDGRNGVSHVIAVEPARHVHLGGLLSTINIAELRAVHG